jgi:alpha-maltose-1-phosphate synthase
MSEFHALLIDFEYFTYTIQLANALSDLCRVTIMLPDRASTYYAETIKKEVDVHPFHMPRIRYPTNIFMVRALFKAIVQAQPQVVHELSWSLWMNLARPMFPRVPLVATIHDVSRHPGDRQSFELLLDRQWRRADQVIVHAEAIKHQLVNEAGVSAHKVNVIPLGAYDLYRNWTGSDIHEQTNTILFFGRIWEYKGLQFLIEAEPLITQQVPNARIVIAGEGESFEKYERLMVHKDRFLVHNYYIPDEMIARLFQEASIVVLPYIEASQSAVLAIAYAFGKPVIATPVGGIPEVLENGKTGYLVPPRDAQSLAKAVITLLQNPELRKEMGRNALEKARSDLSWSSIAHTTLQVYQKASSTYMNSR